MKRFAIVLAAVLVTALPAATAGTDRFPVGSRDDGTTATELRIDAVTSVVATMDARLGRVVDLVGTQPGPPNEPVYGGFLSVQQAAASLLATAGGIVCAQSAGAPNVEGGETISDGYLLAVDTSAEGVAGRLGAIATVLSQADARLARIASVVDVKPGPPTIDSATRTWAAAAAIYNATVAVLGNADHVPPSPICPSA